MQVAFNVFSDAFQFNAFMLVIRDMLGRMEAEHKTKLEQLHIMQEQQRFPFKFNEQFVFIFNRKINTRLITSTSLL